MTFGCYSPHASDCCRKEFGDSDQRPATESEYLVAEHGGNEIVFFTQNYTVGVLQAKWYPGTQAGVPLKYGEAIKPEGGSWSWDLRVPYQAKQAANAQIAALMQPGQVRLCLPMWISY